MWFVLFTYIHTPLLFMYIHTRHPYWERNVRKDVGMWPTEALMGIERLHCMKIQHMLETAAVEGGDDRNCAR